MYMVRDIFKIGRTIFVHVVVPTCKVIFDIAHVHVLKTIVPEYTQVYIFYSIPNTFSKPKSDMKDAGFAPFSVQGGEVQMCINIAEGMECLAENRFIDRDLAARNCMYADVYYSGQG